MDNLTHSLAGALLGQLGLKRLTGRAMGTLVIAANLPDIDAFAAFIGPEGLAIRRGITHGPIAMLVLPVVLTGLVLAWDRWRPSRHGIPVRPWAVLLLAFIGTLSHPALDWLNSYGIRLLEPFSSQWSYGDTLFIIDVWLWAALIAGYGLSRWWEKRGRSDWRAPAVASFVVIAAYIGANGLITARAEDQATGELHAVGIGPSMVVAAPQPLHFWTRRMLWRDELQHGAGHYHLADGLRLDPEVLPNNLDHPALLASLERQDVKAFLFWSRMPVIIEQDGQVLLADQRFVAEWRSRRVREGRYRYDPFTVPLDRAGASQ